MDFESGNTTRRLGPLWSELARSSCPSPLSPNFSESVTNVVSWYDPGDPAPEIIEERGTPAGLRLKDPKGQWFTLPFRLEPPVDR